MGPPPTPHTGAGSGIGQRLAVAFAEAGADVACFDLSAAGMAITCKTITDLGRRALAVAGSVTSKDDLHSAVESAERELGPLSVAANCAGEGAKNEAQPRPAAQPCPATVMGLDRVVPVPQPFIA